jgi:hypothetical protein
MRQYRALLRGQGTSIVGLYWAGCIINMSGFDLRQAQAGHGPRCARLGELIVEDSWLNQLDDVILGHGISLLRWRSGGVKHPHDMPPSRFPTSPTLGDSSRLSLLENISTVGMVDRVGTISGVRISVSPRLALRRPSCWCW